MAYHSTGQRIRRSRSPTLVGDWNATALRTRPRRPPRIWQSGAHPDVPGMLQASGREPMKRRSRRNDLPLLRELDCATREGQDPFLQLWLLQLRGGNGQAEGGWASRDMARSIRHAARGVRRGTLYWQAGHHLWPLQASVTVAALRSTRWCMSCMD